MLLDLRSLLEVSITNVAVSASDSIAIGLAESSATAVVGASAEALAVIASEAAAATVLAVGTEAIAVPATETTAGAVAGDAPDVLAVAALETSLVLADLDSADAVAVPVLEVTDISIPEIVDVSAVDAVGVSVLEVTDIAAVEPADTSDGYNPGVIHYYDEAYRAWDRLDRERRRRPERLPWPKPVREPVAAEASPPDIDVAAVPVEYVCAGRCAGGAARVQATATHKRQVDQDDRDLRTIMDAIMQYEAEEELALAGAEP